jgi:NAD(P)H-hydrate epimerase
MQYKNKGYIKVMYLVYATEMQEMDRLTIEAFGIPGRVLMENAGRGATEILLRKKPDIHNKSVGIIAGRGNNGGDGFVMARYLVQKGIKVVVYLLTDRDRVVGDAAANLHLLEPLEVPVVELRDREEFCKNIELMLKHDIWIDAILGTGLKSDVKGFFREIIEFINSLKKYIFSVDIPSGLNSDTGLPCGIAARANATATFAFAKTGHILYPGAEYTGDLEIVDIGIPPHIADEVGPRQYLITPDMVRFHIRSRKPDAHKGDAGHLLVVAASTGKTGAAAMTAGSAMRVGAGLVTLGIPESLNHVLETQLIEAMTFPLPERTAGILGGEDAFVKIMALMPGKQCLATGPGLGTDPDTIELICRIVQACEIPIVIDADGLNSLVGRTDILNKLKAPAVLTPHPGEMARLANITTREVQSNRISCAREFALKFNVHIVLKGACTVIAHPDGSIYVNTTGNPGMASGGMGDVLTGIIAGLITQGLSIKKAAQVGVFLHGATADHLSEKIGPTGFLATEVMDEIPQQIKRVQTKRVMSEYRRYSFNNIVA